MKDVPQHFLLTPTKVHFPEHWNHRVLNSGVMDLHCGFNWIMTAEAGPAGHATATRNGLLESQYRKNLTEKARPLLLRWKVKSPERSIPPLVQL